MKKILSTIMAGLMVMGLAAPAFADTRPVETASPPVVFKQGGMQQHRTQQHRFGATVTSNWSGYVINSGPYSSTSARWKVPGATWGQTNYNPYGYEYNTIWIGIDGFNTQTLIQLGTETMVSQSGQVMQYVWYELYPAVSVNIAKPVSTGDIMTASITCTANCVPNTTQTWQLSMSNVTQNWTWSQSFQFASTMVSAEWIVESPYYNGWLPLNNYGKATFDSILVNGANPGLTPGNGLALFDQPGGQTSNPSDPINGNQFSTCWGFGSYTPCPVGSVDGTNPVPQVPTASLTANPAAITQGQSSTLAWGSSNATSCTGTGFDTGLASSGSATVAPSVTAQYGVSCSGTGGTASANASVVVSAPQPVAPTVTMTGLPSWINRGQTSTLRWSSQNATSCTGAGFDTLGKTIGKVNVVPWNTTTYTVTCTGAGGSATTSATIHIRYASTL